MGDLIGSVFVAVAVKRAVVCVVVDEDESVHS